MLLKHHDLEIELPDEWWEEACMACFRPKACMYYIDRDAYPEVRAVPIDEVAPVFRSPGVNIFNDRKEETARERVLRIFSWFRSGAEIEPIKIIEGSADDEYPYRLTEGVHRFYCSLAAGFSHVPTIPGFDSATLDG